MAMLTFARTTCQAPTRAGLITEEPYEPDEAHVQNCPGQGCARCRFERGFRGCLRPGSARVHPPDPRHAWMGWATYMDATGQKRTWLTVRPYGWGGPFAWGCWLCNVYTAEMHPFALIQARTRPEQLTRATFTQHTGTRGHQAAEAAAAAAAAAAGAEPPNVAPALGVFTGASDTVPRLDRFVAAATLVARNLACSDFEHLVSSGAVGAMLPQGGDASRKAAAQLVVVLAEPLCQRDLSVLRCAKCAALALDERDSVVLLLLRFVYEGHPDLGKLGVYECLGGIVRDQGPGPQNVAEAVRSTLRRFCMTRRGRRPSASSRDGSLEGPEDTVDEEAFAHLRCILRVAVADGGPSEQKALYELSPAGPDGENAFFPNLTFITRDRAHRARSIQKGMWEPLDEKCNRLLTYLISGERSLASMLEHSRKYSLIWEEMQRRACVGEQLDLPYDLESFAKVVRNMSYAAQRFDSRGRPLLIFFHLLGVAIATVREVARRGGREDRLWAAALLEKFAGRTGYLNLMRAALAADGLLCLERFIREGDVCDDDVITTGRVLGLF